MTLHHQLLIFSFVFVVAPSLDLQSRDRNVALDFQRHNPCPVTQLKHGPCPGWQKDHIQSLCSGGPDTIENMQWLTVEQHRLKTKIDVAQCRKHCLPDILYFDGSMFYYVCR